MNITKTNQWDDIEDPGDVAFSDDARAAAKKAVDEAPPKKAKPRHPELLKASSWNDFEGAARSFLIRMKSRSPQTRKSKYVD